MSGITKKILMALAIVVGIGAVAPVALAQYEGVDCSQIADPDERAACEDAQAGGQ